VSIAITERGTSSPVLSPSLIQEFYLFLTYEQVKLILAVEIDFIYEFFFYRCTVHFDIYKVHTPTNVLLIKFDKVLKFTLKVTLTCSYMFRSTTIIREPSLEPS